MTFPEFIEAVDERLGPAGARLVDGEEGQPISWITFSRAGCLYRLSLDQQAATINLERGQGSFIVNSPMTWKHLEGRQPEGLDLESALPVVDDFLMRFARRA